MPELTVKLTIEDLRKAIFQLPPLELIELFREIEERSETNEMMRLAETGFQEWLEPGEDIYDE
ncbi:hypothetical protein DRQ11_12625 [candidate division KSB1 bacterium]|nr:MAG: hypothetical protein DRQ11_12625 [candidate division KSB1 bacterium]